MAEPHARTVAEPHASTVAESHASTVAEPHARTVAEPDARISLPWSLPMVIHTPAGVSITISCVEYVWAGLVRAASSSAWVVTWMAVMDGVLLCGLCGGWRSRLR